MMMSENATEVLYGNASSENDTLDCADFNSGVSAAFQVTTYVMYCSVFVLALVGNGIVCYIVCSSARMRSVTNYLIVNLAIGDMLMASLCVPFSFVSTLLLRHWPFGGALCKAINYSQAVSVFVSSYTLVAISADRYVAIVYPLRPRMTFLHAKGIIACVWTVALLTALPIPLVSALDQPEELHRRCGLYICQELWPGQEGPWRLDGDTQKYYYSMALMVFQYLIPLLALLLTYARIALVVWGGRPPSELQGDVRAQRMARSKKKVIKMMLMVVLVYTLCWIPQHTLTILGDAHEAIWAYDQIAWVWFACHWLSMSHTCYNPIIYCWMNAKFRAGFRAVLASLPCAASCPSRVLGDALDAAHGAEETHRLRRGTTRTNTYTMYSVLRTGPPPIRARQRGESLRLATVNNNNNNPDNPHPATPEVATTDVDGPTHREAEVRQM
ncbi:unnamed protein product [Notodromas monacha]|uniref:G-protein coupled receptors family 1 profile domain-containing protein n=1 Tax=Notodromas monacha TaxID=399045 RepID=A0A7R9BRB2_9CRUS|nr:unnamed protein product [Notodromas monacha]CAG0919366.1 unnamed protein product [Notodromas monacha]